MSRARMLVFALVAAAASVSSVARAQTLSQSGVLYPDRIVNGQDLGSSTRPQNLNPNGISYADCIADMTLRFTIGLNGFTGSDSIKIWASLTSPCTSPPDRGIGATAPICWLVNGGETDPIINTATTHTYDIRVQDIVGWQAVPPISGAVAAAPPAKGPEACTAQASFAAVPININFLALDSSGNSDGTAYQYSINTDMVGPPAPAGQGESVGHTLFNISWTANTDSDTAGYDVFMDPIPGQETAETGAAVEAGRTLVCPPETGAPGLDATAPGDESGTGDGAVEASSVPDASSGPCYYINTGSSSQGQPGAHCNDPILQSSIGTDAGADAQVVTVAAQYDDAGNLISEGGVENGAGGISTIPSQYLVGVSSSTGLTISDKAVGQYQVQGLIDNVWYNAVVAAVDGTGNIGPPSPEVCDYPAPVQDFWQTYKNDGGAAGGFCALDAVGAGGTSLAGVAAVVAGAAIARRRRRSEHRS